MIRTINCVRYLSGLPPACMCLLSVIWGEGITLTVTGEKQETTNYWIFSKYFQTHLPAPFCSSLNSQQLFSSYHHHHHRSPNPHPPNKKHVCMPFTATVPINLKDKINKMVKETSTATHPLAHNRIKSKRKSF